MENQSIDYKELEYGFKYGDAKIERHISDRDKGWIVLGLETSKHKLQIYVTKTGKVRICDEYDQEWKPPKRLKALKISY